MFDHSEPKEDVRFSVEHCFYVYNCLQSLPSADEAKKLVDKLKHLLTEGRFDLGKWVSNLTASTTYLKSLVQRAVSCGSPRMAWNPKSTPLDYDGKVCLTLLATSKVTWRKLYPPYKSDPCQPVGSTRLHRPIHHTGQGCGPEALE